MAVQLIYETHSRTVDNERGIATGWLPGELSADGRRFAQELGRRWKDTDLAAVYTSDLRRAVQTAEIAFAGRSILVVKDRRLRECNYGALNGMPVTRLEAERAQHLDTPYPDGQSYRQVVDGMRSFLRQVAPRYQNQTILVIAHSANRWALQCLLDGRMLEALVGAPFDWQPGWRFTLPDTWS
jgi:broad specificity phosphatase PhoE